MPDPKVGRVNGEKQLEEGGVVDEARTIRKHPNLSVKVTASIGQLLTVGWKAEKTPTCRILDCRLNCRHSIMAQE